MAKTYKFYIVVTGTGDNIEQAWHKALSNNDLGLVGRAPACYDSAQAFADTVIETGHDSDILVEGALECTQETNESETKH